MNSLKCLIISIFGLFCICYGYFQNEDLLMQSLLLDDKSVSNSTDSTSAVKKEEKENGIQTLTLVICGITIAYWFITLIVIFILCMKYMGSQKKRAIPLPKEQLSNVEYEEFSEVPDEANSKIQGIKQKMGKAVKRSGGKKQEGSAQDEFAM
uniref:Uncharacterized protein n=1 Tax=Panagrolaimus davidi TaxID=227884 RepID=A0A914PRY4_9BILA